MPGESARVSRVEILIQLSQYFQLHLGRVNNGATLKDMAVQAAPFLQAVTPYLNGLNNSIYNIVCGLHSCADNILTWSLVERK